MWIYITVLQWTVWKFGIVWQCMIVCYSVGQFEVVWQWETVWMCATMWDSVSVCDSVWEVWDTVTVCDSVWQCDSEGRSATVWQCVTVCDSVLQGPQSPEWQCVACERTEWSGAGTDVKNGGGVSRRDRHRQTGETLPALDIYQFINLNWNKIERKSVI